MTRTDFAIRTVVSGTICLILSLPHAPLSGQEERDATSGELPAAVEQQLGSNRLNHQETITAVRYAPHGNTIASGDETAKLMLWNTNTGQFIHPLKGHTAGIGSIAFSPDGQLIASADHHGILRIWNANTNNHVHTFESSSSFVRSLAFSPSGKQLVSTGGSSIELWSITKKTKLREFSKNKKTVRSVDFSPEGKWILSGGHGKTVDLWNVSTGKLKASFDGHDALVQSVRFSPDGKTMASAGNDGTIRIRSMPNGTRSRVISVPSDASPILLSLTFSPDARYIAAGSYDGKVRIWNVSTGELTNTISAGNEPVSSMDFHPDGKRLAIGGSRIVQIRNVTSGNVKFSGGGHTNAVRSISFFPDGRRVATGSEDHTVRTWDLTDGTALRKMTGHTGAVTSLDVSSRGNRLASGAADESVRVWTFPGGKPLQSFQADTGTVQPVLLSRDGTRIHFRRKNRIMENNVSNKKNVHSFKFPRSTLLSMDLSPNGELLACGAKRKNNIYIIDRYRGKIIQTLTAHQAAVNDVAFSPGGKWLVSGSSAATIDLWNVNSGKHIRTYNGHVHSVRTVRFSPDGGWIISGGKDGTIRLWESVTGREAIRFHPDSGGVHDLSVAEKTDQFASAHDNTTALVWSLDPADWWSHPDASDDRDVEITDETLWNTVRGVSDTDPYYIIGTLSTLPNEKKDALVTVLARRVQPFLSWTESEKKNVKNWIKKLQNNDRSVRKHAQKHIFTYIRKKPDPLQTLNRFLRKTTDPEAKIRLRIIQSKIKERKLVETYTERRKSVLFRASRALVQMGTPEARKVLNMIHERLPTSNEPSLLQNILDRKK